jgi:hypothetical protein
MINLARAKHKHKRVNSEGRAHGSAAKVDQLAGMLDSMSHQDNTAAVASRRHSSEEGVRILNLSVVK